MHEHFKFGLRNCTMNLAYLGKREFTRKYNTWKTDISKEARLGRSAVIHLRTRMQGNRRNIHPCYAHILNDESINANLIQLGHKSLDILNLIIIYYRVQRHIHLDTINVGILHKSRGEGTRLRPLTCDCPKPMIRLMEQPVMQYALALLRQHGITDIAVTLGYLDRKSVV